MRTTRKFRTVGSFEARTRLSGLIGDVQKGVEFTITRRGKPVAKLGPCDNGKDEEVNIEELLLAFDSIRKSARGRVDIREFVAAGRKY
jgi:prevent-host-death family protein